MHKELPLFPESVPVLSWEPLEKKFCFLGATGKFRTFQAYHWEGGFKGNFKNGSLYHSSCHAAVKTILYQLSFLVYIYVIKQRNFLVGLRLKLKKKNFLKVCMCFTQSDVHL